MGRIKKVGVFHPGTQHSWQTARALRDADLLAWYATTIFYDPDKWPYCVERFLPSGLAARVHREFGRFYHPQVDRRLVHTFGMYQWLARLAGRTGLPDLFASLIHKGNISFGRKTSKLVERIPVDALWGYDLASLEAFEYAARIGIRRILDVTIGHPRVYRRILREVYDSFPEFFTTFTTDVSDEQIRRKDRELELADIVLVGSEYCKDTLVEGYEGHDLHSKIQVVNYCYDDVFFADTTDAELPPVRHPINFIFLGQVDPRKGAHILLKAFDRIPRSAANLTIVGNMQIPARTFAQFADRVQFHPTVPRREVKQFLQDSDCLVFPSLFEGAGLVLYEALASGLGIIQSSHADIAVDTETGHVLEEISEQCLYAAIMDVVDNPSRLTNWRANAKRRALRYTYSRYRAAVAEVVSSL